MIHMIVLTELFIIFKHGRNSFDHAFIPKLGFVFLGTLAVIFLFIFVKVLISDLINWNKSFKVMIS